MQIRENLLKALGFLYFLRILSETFKGMFLLPNVKTDDTEDDTFLEKMLVKVIICLTCIFF